MGFKELAMQRDLHRPLARNSDKTTSHLAARHMVESGKLNAQMLEVLELVKKHPNCTAFELTRYTNLDRYQIQRRLSDLSEIGKVTATETKRRCSVSGRAACTWDVVEVPIL